MNPNDVKTIFEQQGMRENPITPHILAYGHYRDEILYVIESSAESMDTAGPFDQFGIVVLTRHNEQFMPNFVLSNLCSTPEQVRDHIKMLESLYDETEDVESMQMLEAVKIAMA